MTAYRIARALLQTFALLLLLLSGSSPSLEAQAAVIKRKVVLREGPAKTTTNLRTLQKNEQLTLLEADQKNGYHHRRQKMAAYKYSQFLSVNSHDVFDKVFTPGTPAPFSGIYRCEACGNEDACNYSLPLPPENHHQHKPGQGSVRWRMVVGAQ